MHTTDDAHRIDNNPDLLHVGIVDGKLWLSDDAQEDIRGFTGFLPDTDSPLRMLRFLQSECRRLQAQDDPLGPDEAQRNFLAFCALKGLEHAIETKYLGPAHVGAFKPEGLIAAFFCPPLAASLSLN